MHRPPRLPVRSAANRGRLRCRFTLAITSCAGVLGNGTLLQLDLINNFNGGWAWVAMDAVQINGVVTPEPASLAIWGVVIAGGLLVARRRKA